MLIPAILDKIMYRYPMLADAAGNASALPPIDGVSPDDLTDPDFFDDEPEPGPEPAPAPAPAEPAPAPAAPAPASASAEPPKQPPPATATEPVAFSPDQQAHMDRIIGERLARERRVRDEEQARLAAEAQQRQAAEAQRNAEAQVAQQEQQWFSARVDALAKRLTEVQGYDEATARQIAAEQAGTELQTARTQTQISILQRQIEEQRQRDAQVQQIVRYQGEKQAHLAANPLARLYEPEIEALAQGGNQFPWKVAFAAVLAAKADQPDFLQRIQDGARNKTLAEQQRNAGRRVGGATQPAGDPDVSLSRDELRIAAAMGQTAKEYAAAKAAAARDRRRQ
jgi:hypothetical protein